jgi:acyl carrier protein
LQEQEIFERTRRIIAQEKRLPPERIVMESTFAELGIDSLEGVGIIYALENEFHISIPDDAMGKIQDVAQIVHGIGRLSPT